MPASVAVNVGIQDHTVKSGIFEDALREHGVGGSPALTRKST